jgi:pseudaminic acid cytidylyltransferase
VRVAIIPARGGSVRLPRKNIRDFHGLPMLAYPLIVASVSKLFDLTIVSTDDAEIASFAFLAGAIAVPREVDDGSIGTQEIAALVMDKLQLQGSAACVIYPCTPLLDVFHLKQGYAELLKPHNKAFVRAVGPDGQDAGCFYWGWMRAFRDRRPLDAFNTADYRLPAERVCDINTPEDWALAESMFEALRRAP